jgi:hypothetical protein
MAGEKYTDPTATSFLSQCPFLVNAETLLNPPRQLLFQM